MVARSLLHVSWGRSWEKSFLPPFSLRLFSLLPTYCPDYTGLLGNGVNKLIVTVIHSHLPSGIDSKRIDSWIEYYSTRKLTALINRHRDTQELRNGN